MNTENFSAVPDWVQTFCHSPRWSLLTRQEIEELDQQVSVTQCPRLQESFCQQLDQTRSLANSWSDCSLALQERLVVQEDFPLLLWTLVQSRFSPLYGTVLQKLRACSRDRKKQAARSQLQMLAPAYVYWRRYWEASAPWEQEAACRAIELNLSLEPGTLGGKGDFSWSDFFAFRLTATLWQVLFLLNLTPCSWLENLSPQQLLEKEKDWQVLTLQQMVQGPGFLKNFLSRPKIQRKDLEQFFSGLYFFRSCLEALLRTQDLAGVLACWEKMQCYQLSTSLQESLQFLVAEAQHPAEQKMVLQTLSLFPLISSQRLEPDMILASALLSDDWNFFQQVLTSQGYGSKEVREILPEILEEYLFEAEANSLEMVQQLLEPFRAEGLPPGTIDNFILLFSLDQENFEIFSYLLSFSPSRQRLLQEEDLRMVQKIVRQKKNIGPFLQGLQKMNLPNRQLLTICSWCRERKEFSPSC